MTKTMSGVALLLAMCPIPLVFVAFSACGDNRGGSVPAIRASLAAIPTVSVVDVVGSDEVWPFFGPEGIRADVQVGRTGRLLLCDLTLESFSGSKPFIIARVNDWTPIVHVSEDSAVRYVGGCPESVDVSANSPFLQLVPFPIRTVADVITNFAELKNLIESWSEAPTRVQTKDGRAWIEYHKQRFSAQKAGGARSERP
jgi:hypothetical protein